MKLAMQIQRKTVFVANVTVSIFVRRSHYGCRLVNTFMIFPVKNFAYCSQLTATDTSFSRIGSCMPPYRGVARILFYGGINLPRINVTSFEFCRHLATFHPSFTVHSVLKKEGYTLRKQQQNIAALFWGVDVQIHPVATPLHLKMQDDDGQV